MRVLLYEEDAKQTAILRGKAELEVGQYKATTLRNISNVIIFHFLVVCCLA